MPASILVVVRDRIVADFLRHAAASLRADVAATRNSGDALARAHAQPPRAVVIGLDLDAAALALVKEFRADLATASTPVLLVGRPGQEPRAAAGLELGAVGFLKLPLEEEATAARLREVIGWSLPSEDDRLVVAGPAAIDLVTRRLMRPRPIEPLTRCEFEILRWLLMPAGRSYTRR